MLIIQCPSLALQACYKRLPEHCLHSRRRLIQRCSINWRDAASTACAGRAGVLGDQAVAADRQNPGLTARNSSHGELTAIDQSAAHRTRGDAQTRATPACGIHWRAAWNIMNPTKKQASTIRIRDLRAVRSRNEIVRPHSWCGRGFTKYVGCS